MDISVDCGTEDRFRACVESLGFKLWGVSKIFSGRITYIRVYIENPDGVNAEQCQEVTSALGSEVYGMDPFQGPFRLEVSSPDADRELFRQEQYRGYIGSSVKLMTYELVVGRKYFKGIIGSVKGENIVLKIGATEVALAFSNVRKCCLE